MLKIIIPIAGSSKLFSDYGYYYPKPLIEVNGLPMIERVLRNPLSIDKSSLIFIIKEEEAIKFHLDNTLKILVPDADIIKLSNETKGGLCSVLMAIDKVDSEDELLILNGDQIIDVDLYEVYTTWKSGSADAGLIIFQSVHPRWAFVRLEDGIVVQSAEKNPISNHAIAGAYYFKKAKDFFNAAFDSVMNNVQLEGLFYISPVINQYVLQNKRVVSFKIEAKQYHLFYSPQVLQEYERQTQNK